VCFFAAIYLGPKYFIDGQISLYECSIKLTTWGFDVMKVRVTLKIVLVLYVKFRPAGLIVNCKSQAPTGSRLYWIVLNTYNISNSNINNSNKNTSTFRSDRLSAFYKSFFFLFCNIGAIIRNLWRNDTGREALKTTGNTLNKLKKNSRSITEPRAAWIPLSPLYHHLLIPFLVIFHLLFFLFIEWQRGKSHEGVVLMELKHL